MHKVGLFGTYSDSPQYSRTTALRNALTESGFDVREYRAIEKLDGDRSKSFQSSKKILIAITRVIKNWLKLIAQSYSLREQDIVLVPYPSHVDVFLAKVLLIGSGTPLLMDAFLGLKDTLVNDRELIPKNSVAAKIVHIWEYLVFRLADRIIFDTHVQCHRAAAEYNLPEEKLVSIPVGIDEKIWKPFSRKETEEPYQVLFWGTFIPLHGIEYIIKAAKLLESDPLIKFTIIGEGQTASDIEKLLGQFCPKNLQWIRSIMPIEALVIHAANANCILGIFGGSEKAASVIPYKIYQALASNRPVITRETPVFHGEDVEQFGIYQIPPENPEALAKMLSRLARKKNITCSNPRKYYDLHLSQDVINAQVRQLINVFPQ